MVQTRAQERAGAPEAEKTSLGEIKRSQSKIGELTASKEHASKKAKAISKGAHRMREGQDTGKSSESKPTASKATENPSLKALMDKYGTIPLEKTDVKEPLSPHPDTLSALLLNAMLSSARISHELAARTVNCIIKANYHKIDALKESSWQQRTEVLTEGGYTRYREKTATFLGDLAALLDDKYDGDLNNLLKSAEESPLKIRKSLKEIKGLGDVGVDVFFDTAQAVWPCLAPFIDPRSKKTAESIGIGSDVEKLWKEVGEDPVEMCKLASALTTVRLEKKEAEFKS
ncbi:hypothetical protein F4779DRAFT_603373 [Xylariaceae sp. FL0662B]|nr:hypothetical protein F4779DRAFT_603373 [Xylariaceae sp. FL0662B]